MRSAKIPARPVYRLDDLVLGQVLQRLGPIDRRHLQARSNIFDA